MSALEAIRWQQGPPASLKLLDQRLLPLQSVYIDIDGPQAAFTAIKVPLLPGCSFQVHVCYEWPSDR